MIDKDLQGTPITGSIKKIEISRNIENRSAVHKSRAPVFFLLHGEGPRSRCYGRTIALRLFVQPYDEDEDEQFFTKFYK
jgi:hypothetical protein